LRRAAVLTALFLTCAPRPARAQDPPAPTESTANDEVLQPPPEPTPPPAQPEPAPPPPEPPSRVRFGSAGVFMATTDSAITIGKTTYGNSDAEVFVAAFSPGLDYFIVDRVSIGIDLALTYADARGYAADSSLVRTETTALSGGPRIGVDLPIGRYVSFYPRLTLGLESIRRDDSVVQARSSAPPSNAVGIPESSRDGPWISVFAPLLVHPAPHFFVGAGPTFFHAFARVRGGPDIGGERTSVGGHLVFGVWWGGREDGANAEDAAAEAKRAPKLGEVGQVVFSGDFSIFGDRTTYAGTGSSTESLNLAPAIDFFVARHVSIGLGAFYGFGNQRGLRADNTPTTQKVSAAGISPRVGVDIPLTSWLSFYPRGSLGYASRSYETRAGTDGYEYTEGVATLSLFAPLLVHPATHAFIGFGPFGAYDVVRKIQGTEIENPATSFGGRLVIGGWL
jgi:hypothetical protein